MLMVCAHHSSYGDTVAIGWATAAGLGYEIREINDETFVSVRIGFLNNRVVWKTAFR